MIIPNHQHHHHHCHYHNHNVNHRHHHDYHCHPSMYLNPIMSSLCHLEQINERHIFKYLVNWDSFDDSDHKTMVMMKMILPSLAARRQPPCLSCSYDFGPNSPGDGDFDGDDDGDDDDDNDD